ncbi:hypothetical protein QYM36_004364 [Artemia franciscana]|uniref:Uncharacterized protein n=1 Tax=Artemia franciscana TaxID=6661 RepID=A0AA88I9L8_ARTSF|nr:hypothetical protein QYM36_004364 [Artemia franciscana]
MAGCFSIDEYDNFWQSVIVNALISDDSPSNSSQFDFNNNSNVVPENKENQNSDWNYTTNQDTPCLVNGCPFYTAQVPALSCRSFSSNDSQINPPDEAHPNAPGTNILSPANRYSFYSAPVTSSSGSSIPSTGNHIAPQTIYHHTPRLNIFEKMNRNSIQTAEVSAPEHKNKESPKSKSPARFAGISQAESIMEQLHVKAVRRSSKDHNYRSQNTDALEEKLARSTEPTETNVNIADCKDVWHRECPETSVIVNALILDDSPSNSLQFGFKNNSNVVPENRENQNNDWNYTTNQDTPCLVNGCPFYTAPVPALSCGSVSSNNSQINPPHEVRPYAPGTSILSPVNRYSFYSAPVTASSGSSIPSTGSNIAPQPIYHNTPRLNIFGQMNRNSIRSAEFSAQGEI